MNTNVRVLIVEDREEHQRIFQEIVNSLAFYPFLVSNLRDAINMLERMTFHVALVDLRLVDEEQDNWDGFKVLNHLKNSNEGTKAIVLTAFGEVEQASDAFRNYDVYHFIRKSKMDIVEVGTTIRKAAEEASQEMMRPSRSMLPLTAIFGQDAESLMKDMFKDLKNKNAISELRDTVRNSDELSSFLRQALHDYQPIIPAIQRKLERHILPNGHISLRTKFWSKALGAPIVIWFGKKDEMQHEISNLEESEVEQKKLGYIKKLADLSNTSNSQLFGGIIYSSGDMRFENFSAQQSPIK